MKNKNLKFAAIALIVLVIISYVFFVRPYHMRWGATEEELTMPLPGDVFIHPDAIISTRAVTINASASEIWPWVVQIGQDRGGFYSYEWLENIFAADMHNTERIIPEFQQLRVGDRVSMQKEGPASAVTLIETERALVLDEGWTFYLQPIDVHSTRLIMRYPWDFENNQINKFYYFIIFEPAHFVMETGMMLGIKQRAERSE